MANRVLDVGKSIPSGSLVGRLYGGDGPALVVSVSDLVGQLAASGAFLTPGTAPLIVVSAGTGISVSHSGTTYTVEIDPAYVGQSSITTLGTITSGVWNGTAIANANLANSSVTVGSTNIALGATAATISGMTVSGGTLTGATTLPGPASGGIGAGTLDSVGRLLLQDNTFWTLGVSNAAAYQSSTKGLINLFLVEASNAATQSCDMFTGKSRGVDHATAVAVIAGDPLFRFRSHGDDGSTAGSITVKSAEFGCFVEGTVSTGVVGANYRWSTMNTGGTFAERMRLTAAGGLSVGTTTDAGTQNILAAGTVTANTGGSALGDQIIAGAKVSTATLTKTSNTTLATVTGLSVALAAGKTYMIQGWLSGTSGGSGGIKVALVASGGLTATSALFQAFAYNGTTALGNTTVTALGSNIVASTAIYTDIYIEGSITVNVAGTINVQAAQNVSNGTSTTVIAGSTFSCLRVN